MNCDWITIITISAGIFTVIGTAVAAVSFIYVFLRNFKTDINEHMDKLENRLVKADADITANFNERMDKLENRLVKADADITANFNERMDKLEKGLSSANFDLKSYIKHSTERTDRLYEMFVDLLQDKRKTNP